jgi:hypothetical protein
MRRTVLALAAVLSAATAAGAAEPTVFYMDSGLGSPIGLPFASDAAVPSCDSTVSEVGWRAGASFVEWVHETGAGEYPSFIGRRYCEARAVVDEDRTSSIYYLIETHQYFAGVGAKVTFCVPEHDRWRIYDANCRTVRPLH